MTYRYWETDEVGRWLRHRTGGVNEFNHAHNGKGDIFWWMAIYALITGDVDVIKALIKLANEKKRWPNSMNSSRDAKTRTGFYISKWLYKLGITKQRLYRPQKDITRDPLTMLLIAVYWHQYEMIQDIKIPFWIQRPSFYHWVKYLKTNKQKHKNRYEFWETFESETFGSVPGYVLHLNCWRAWIVKSDLVKTLLRDQVEEREWNWLIRELNGDECLCQIDIDNLELCDGYIWNLDNEDKSPDLLGPDEPFYFDKEILQFVFDNQNWK